MLPEPVDTFTCVQLEFTAHLRDPVNVPPPVGIEDRRLAIYRGLIYNNIENFIATGFPVLRSILPDSRWHGLVGDFIRVHRCHSPYFLDIGKEFLLYLQGESSQGARRPQDWEPPFLLELCHYEWVELALDTANTVIPDNVIPGSVIPDSGARTENALAAVYGVSPLAWRLTYSFPVHKISAAFQPGQPAGEMICIVVYRNREDQVRFLEVNSFVIRLLQSIDEKELTGEAVLKELCDELNYGDETAFLAYGAGVLERLHKLDILYTKG